MYLDIRSTFSILPHTTMCWENNHANLGGAIFVNDNSPSIYCSQTSTEREKCFFQLPGQNLSNGPDVKLVFKNNSADAAGSVLYGGAIDNCKLIGLDTYRSGAVFDMLFHIKDDTNYSTTSNISSDPLQICLCKDNLPDCSVSINARFGFSVYPYYDTCNYLYQYYGIPCSVYPGEAFQISVVAVGQRNGTLSSTVRGAVRDTYSYPVNLLDYQYLQQTNNTCTKINYTVFTLSESDNRVASRR